MDSHLGFSSWKRDLLELARKSEASLELFLSSSIRVKIELCKDRFSKPLWLPVLLRYLV